MACMSCAQRKQHIIQMSQAAQQRDWKTVQSNVSAIGASFKADANTILKRVNFPSLTGLSKRK